MQYGNDWTLSPLNCRKYESFSVYVSFACTFGQIGELNELTGNLGPGPSSNALITGEGIATKPCRTGCP